MARRRRLIWKVAPLYLLVISISTASIAWYAGDVVHRTYTDRTARELEQKANLFAPQAARMLLHDDAGGLRRHVRRIGRASGARITIIDGDGAVLADSESDAAAMDNHANRIEVRQALAQEYGRATRYSQTTRKRMMYVTKLIRPNLERSVVVRMAIPLTELDDALGHVYRRIALGGLALAGIAALLALLVFQRWIGRPLHRLRHAAARFARGEFEPPLAGEQTDEIAALADALNDMAAQLDDKLRTITGQSLQQRAVLAAMVEGVVAVDADENVITINAAAARWLDADERTAPGRKAFEVIRSLALQDLVARALDRGHEIEEELEVRGADHKRFLRAQAAPLRDAQAGEAGVVVVLHDVSQLRRLERIRQQFVANVSHELKTPIAAIKAAVETVLDESYAAGATPPGDDDRHDSSGSAAERFLPVIARQADRLLHIVEDLLTLARIEEQEQEQEQDMAQAALAPVLRSAVETCQAGAAEKGIAVTVEAADAVRARINPPLLEQAVVNLVDNAIKYSPPHTGIVVSAAVDDGEVVLAVRDQGPGIAAEHLPRIFERFYRTDKARSRAMGGTGLGLAIVKHVAQAHGGRVSVDSSQQDGPNRGSTFRIHLPAT